VAVALASAVAETDTDTDGEDQQQAAEELVDLTLPSFPPAPKRDRGFLHEEEEDSGEWPQRSELAFRASSYPRYRSESGQVTGFLADDSEDATLEFGGDETRTMAVSPKAMEDEMAADEELFNKEPVYFERRASLRHTRGGFASEDPSSLPPVPQPLSQWDSSPLPPPPGGMATLAAMAATRANSESDPLFAPLPVAQRQYGTSPVESLSATPTAYAYANAAQPFNAYQPYQPAQSQAFATAPGTMGAVMRDPYANNMAGARLGQDLAQSEYQTYTQRNWPSVVPPPSTYYLPPDVVA